MIVMTRKQERLVDTLVAFAGDPLILHEAPDIARTAEKGRPELAELLRIVLKLREGRGLGRPSHEEMGV